MSMALYNYIFSDFLHISSSQMSWMGTSSNRFYCVDTSAGGLLVSEGIVLPVVSSSALTWFYFFYIYV